jgi:hypothetical protein
MSSKREIDFDKLVRDDDRLMQLKISQKVLRCSKRT